MREILYRGRRIHFGEGRWVKGMLCRGLFSSYCIQIDDGRIYEVDNTTVGQYVGICDINRVKVFEGDIVKFCVGNGNYEVFCVEWSEKLLSFVLVQNNVNVYRLDRSCGGSDCEVIGNIYDNPELLKGGVI